MRTCSIGMAISLTGYADPEDLVRDAQKAGLLVNGWSNQFRLSGSGLGTDASISGSIERSD